MMANKIDLTGKRFGRWKVIEKTDKNKHDARRWLCECECGTERKVLEYNLLKGNSNSCGCLMRELVSERRKGEKHSSLVGNKYGRLTVIKEANAVKYEYGTTILMYECKCSCGESVTVSASGLREGKTKSCGCYQKEVALYRIKKHNSDYGVEQTNLKSLTRKKGKNNNSGTKGVSWNKANKKWRAEIQLNKKSIYLGGFDNKQDAIDARKEAERKYFKPILEKYEGD